MRAKKITIDGHSIRIYKYGKENISIHPSKKCLLGMRGCLIDISRPLVAEVLRAWKRGCDVTFIVKDRAGKFSWCVDIDVC
jgi:hypothetical protein